MLQPSSHTPKKYTVILPAELVERAVAITGGSVRETIETSLENLNHRWAYDQLLKLQGKVDLDIDLAALRNDD